MRKAGCYRVSFGFETGNAEVLTKFGKGGKASLEQGVKAAQMARKANIDVSGFFMLGLSPDTEESMNDTIEYAQKLPLDMLKFGIAIAFPGTSMFNNYWRKGLIKTFNWDDYVIYTSKPLFQHPNLSFDTVTQYMNMGYKKAILFNLKFIFRRIMHSIRSGEIFWDIYYFIKFFFAPVENKEANDVKYFSKNQWPQFDFENKEIEVLPYRAAKSQKTLTSV